MRTCRVCNIEQSLDDFPLHPRCLMGRDTRCHACTKVYQAAWYQKNKAKQAALAKAWRLRNPGRKRDADRVGFLKTKYGITPAEYDRMLAGQGGVCASCFRPPSPHRMLAVDHCHETGRNRGLLCGSCNSAIGMLGDNLEGVQRAVDYLMRYQETLTIDSGCEIMGVSEEIFQESRMD